MTTVVGAVSYNQDWTFEVSATRKNATTRKKEAATPLTGYFGWWSRTEQGAPIHADVKVALTEAASLAGDAYGELDVALMRTHLGPLDGEVVWEVYESSDGQRWSRPWRVVP